VFEDLGDHGVGPPFGAPAKGDVHLVGAAPLLDGGRVLCPLVTVRGSHTVLAGPPGPLGHDRDVERGVPVRYRGYRGNVCGAGLRLGHAEPARLQDKGRVRHPQEGRAEADDLVVPLGDLPSSTAGGVRQLGIAELPAAPAGEGGGADRTAEPELHGEGEGGSARTGPSAGSMRRTHAWLVDGVPELQEPAAVVVARGGV